MPRAYIGLGANLGDPPAQIRAALARIALLAGTRLTLESSLYRSDPIGSPGVRDQPHYCNAVCEVETTLLPERLLEQLHAIESALGRARPPERWAPRLIDLDLLLYEQLCLDSGPLKLPHPEMHRRNFVLVPLAQVAPELEIPGKGSVVELAAELGWAGLAHWPEEPG